VHGPGVRLLRGVMVLVVALFLGLAAVSVMAYREDHAFLAARAAAVTRMAAAPDDKALALLHFVYGQHGFAKNKGFFVLPQLGPTPLDVYERGGDCADKSRLLSAMLQEVGLQSSLAMCFDPEGHPTHTVVDAVLPDGRHMVLDPIWDLYFPRETPHEYYSLLDLRRRPELLFERLAVVTASVAVDAKIRRYNRTHDTYDHASTINWDKSWLTRTIRDVYFGDAGDAVYALPRPEWTEEPQLFVAYAAAGADLGSLALWGVIEWLVRRRRARPTRRGAAA
jgi:hypothetical protein